MQYFHAPIDETLSNALYVSWAGRRQCQGTFRIGPKITDTFMLIYIASGKGYVWQGVGDIQHLEAGSVFVLFPGVKFSYFADSDCPWELMWSAFNGALCEQILAAQGVTPQRYFLKGLLQEQMTPVMEALVTSMGDETDAHRLEAMGHLMILLAEIGRSMKAQTASAATEFSKEEIVPAAIAFIERYYYIHLDVDILCEHIKYSRSYLSRLFNSKCGMAIPEYINQVRIRHAKELFERTALSVQEVSASVGIPDSFYFSKTFKKLSGMSPNQYKKQFAAPRGKTPTKTGCCNRNPQ